MSSANEEELGNSYLYDANCSKIKRTCQENIIIALSYDYDPDYDA